MKWSFEYGFTKVRDLHVSTAKRSKTGKLTVDQMEVGGQPVKPTDRFWRSFFIRFGISDSVFRYFAPAEVFERISEQAADDSLRYCVQHGNAGNPRLLAVSNPNRPMIRYGEVADLVSRYGGMSTTYNEGIVTSTHTPRSGDQTFKIGGDSFQHRFVMETPIDGFSHPKMFLSYLRTVCSNGMIGYGRAFRSDISLGKDIAFCISRALESFDNSEGYAALRQRFESAQKSWASMRECVGLYKCLTKMNDGTSLSAGFWSRDFHRMTGNLNSLYGLANLDALSQKRQRVLPARCRVYDLLNFASEMATHRATPYAERQLQAYIGSLISDEYDMEGTAQTVTDFADFFVKDQDVDPIVN
jgi:hypothetical protein